MLVFAMAPKNWYFPLACEHCPAVVWPLTLEMVSLKQKYTDLTLMAII